MNFLELVLQGFFNENNREFLDRYFYREYKKAEKESFYEAVEFFKGCLDVINNWENHLKSKVFERKNELYFILEKAESGTLKYGDLGGKTIEQKNKETVEYCNTELSTISEYNFTVHLHSLTNGLIAYNMQFNEVLKIKEAILEAYRKTKIETDSTPKEAELVKITPDKIETKTDKLKSELDKYGFFELSKVKQLSVPSKQSLIELISANGLPYSIAMFEYLVFLKHLKAEHFSTDYKLFKAVAKWLEVTERAVKGNIYVLNEHSKENRTRYTADQQKQTVQKDYEKLK